MAIKNILKLGDPGLWKKCEVVEDIIALETIDTIRDLRDTLSDFNKKNGFGRAIAAPQIGVLKRIIYIDFPKAKISGALINPKIIKKSKEKIRIWDDCFSFPDLLVKVERAKEIKVDYQSEGVRDILLSPKGTYPSCCSMRSTIWTASWRSNGLLTANPSLFGATGKSLVRIDIMRPARAPTGTHRWGKQRSGDTFT